MPVNTEGKPSDNTQGQVSWWQKTYKGVRVFGLVFSSLTLPSISVLLLRWFPKSLPSVLAFPALYLGWSIVTDSRFHQLFSFALLVLAMLVHSLAFFPFSVYTISLFSFTTTWSSLCIALSPAQRWVYAPKAVDNNLYDMIEYTNNGHPGDRQFITELVWISFFFSACHYVLIHGSIVAVHGLAANVETTWSSDRRGKNSWLKDKLPFVDGLDSRIFAFNYDSAYQGNALTKTLRDYGEELLRAITKKREREEVR
jgi:hypothetical protein